ncbi:MAG TPA: CsbD family protein [Candidatus Dormibacteraeota bacterium]
MKDKVQGKAEELKGKVTGDRATELKGKARQAVGEAKRLARDLEIDTGRERTEAVEATETKPEPETDPRPGRPTDP